MGAGPYLALAAVVAQVPTPDRQAQPKFRGAGRLPLAAPLQKATKTHIDDIEVRCFFFNNSETGP